MAPMMASVELAITRETMLSSTPNCAPSERWVRSVKEECLSKLILFGERSLRRALREYVEHFHAERNHQGKGNVLLFPRRTNISCDGPVQSRERPGGLLRFDQHRRTSCTGSFATSIASWSWGLFAISSKRIVDSARQSQNRVCYFRTDAVRRRVLDHCKLALCRASRQPSRTALQ
jgi:hypothetical protein